MKLIKIFAITFLVLYSSYNIKAQYPDDHSPYQSIPIPAGIALPNYGESIIDHSVPNPIKITRITEEYHYNDGNGDPQVWYPTHEYSKTQVWNADQTLYKIRTWKVYNANNYQVVQDLDGSALYPSYWSNTDPDLIWSFNENGDIKKYFLSSNTINTIGTITNQAGNAYEFVQLGPGEGNIDKNDHYVALVGKDGVDMDVIVYDLENAAVITRRKFPGCWDNGGKNFPKYVDWVSISQSGNYVVIMWNHNTTSENNPYIENGHSHYGVEVYNAQNMQYQNRLIHYGDHGDLGYAVDGEEVLVQFYGVHQNGIYMYKLNGSGSTTILQNSDFGIDGHISCRNINRPGWAYISLADAAQSGQLLAVKLDDTGTVEYYGHHFSSNTSYDQSPMASASPNGDKMCFRSDFGTGPNTDPSVVYSFIAELDPAAASMNEEASIDIAMYPNPTNDFIRIKSNELIQEIKLFNANGQKLEILKGVNSKKARLNIENLAKGLYILRLTTAKGNITRKFIVE